MVFYTCKFCNRSYNSFEEAKKCEDRGIIGPDIEPGLLLSHTTFKDTFRMVYKQFPFEGHEKIYEIDEFAILSSVVIPIEHINQSSSNFVKSLKNYKPAKQKDIEKVKELVEKDFFPGMGFIKASLEINNIKRIHNNLEEKVDSNF